MDFRKFGQFIILAGVLLAAYGAFQYLTNQPLEAKRSANNDLLGAISDMGNAVGTMSENYTRKAQRESAVKIMLAGAIVGFVGVGMSRSAKS